MSRTGAQRSGFSYDSDGEDSIRDDNVVLCSSSVPLTLTRVSAPTHHRFCPTLATHW